jgi:nucleoid DNA-binding protein
MLRITRHHACRTAAPVLEALEARRLFNAVTSLSLINAQTDQVIQTLTNGDTINLANFPSGQLSVRANTDNQNVQSVRFGLDATANFRVENAAPYALFGDVNGNFTGGTFSVGQHSLTATPFSADNAAGTAGTAQAVSFNVINQPTAIEVTNLVLINAQTDQVIKTLNNGDTINLADFPANQLSIRADVSGGTGVKSVRFRLDSNANFRTENAVPYVIFGDNHGDIVGGTFSVGPHQVVATPFTGANGTGTAGTFKSVTFNVVNNPAPGPNVTGLFLINADSDQVIQEIHDGDTFNRQELPTTNLSVQAITEGSTGSVKFALDQNNNFRVENFAPYALFGDNAGNDFVGGSFSLGEHTLTATAFSGSNATGTSGTAETVKFTFVDDSVAPQVTGLFLINTDTQQVIQEIHDGDTINIGDLPPTHTNVNAVTNASASSVKFGFDGNDSFRTESIAPYALFGDAGGQFVAGTFNFGEHTISATPFTDDNAGGTAGDPLTVAFTLSGTT